MTPPAVPAVDTTLPPFVARRLRDCPAYRIAPGTSRSTRAAAASR